MYKYGPSDIPNYSSGNEKEWYLPNGLGGYASSTIINSNLRKHNGYLVASLNPPVDRRIYLSKLTEKITVNGTTYDLNTQEYDTHTACGYKHLQLFYYGFIPTYIYYVDGVKILKRIAPEYGKNTVAITYEIESEFDCQVTIVPYITDKNHGDGFLKEKIEGKLITANGLYTFTSEDDAKFKLSFPRGKTQVVDMLTENKLCSFDLRSGDDRNDHDFIPFDVTYNIIRGQKHRIGFVATIEEEVNERPFAIIANYQKRQQKLTKLAGFKDNFASCLVVASDLFIAHRKSTEYKTILAGLPWFSDWGRDTMIAFTGLTLTTRRFGEAKEILKSFAVYEKNGLIPNMFPDNNNPPLYNTVDASMWYFYACFKYYEYTGDLKLIEELLPTLESIIFNYKNGTDFSIKMDEDGLIMAGSDLDQLTWMDVRIDGVCVTPRHGKPVEINALWYNALMIIHFFKDLLKQEAEEYLGLAAKVKESFSKFVGPNGLYDVIDPIDVRIRPNQIWAISLPYKIVSDEVAKRVVSVVQSKLYNSYGLRSLDPKDPEFKPIYEGPLKKRDYAYHMGTTWSFPIGGFFDALYYVSENKELAKEQIRKMCLHFNSHLRDGCINGVAEIFDGEYASITRGCSSQAWGVGELLRAYYEIVLKDG